MNWLRNKMIGRYGRMDQLNICLFIVFIVLAVIRFVIGIVVRLSLGGLTLAVNPVMQIIYAVMFGLQMAAVVIVFLRMMSRNIEERARENQKFVNKLYGFRDFKDFRRKKKDARAQGKDLFKCPVCRKQVRVPLGKGKIEITCPNCKNKFVKKT